MGIEFFTNNRYKILSFMASCQIHVNGNKIVPLSQQQIAVEVGLSKKKVNSIIAELKSAGYVCQQSPTRGKYVLTPYADNILATIEGIGV
jgi:biotin operon repressor